MDTKTGRGIGSLTAGQIIFWGAVEIAIIALAVFLRSFRDADGYTRLQDNPATVVAAAILGLAGGLAGAIGPRVLPKAGYWLRLGLGMAGLAAISMSLLFLSWPKGVRSHVYWTIVFALPIFQLAWIAGAVWWRSPESGRFENIRRQIRRQRRVITGGLLESICLGLKIAGAAIPAVIPWCLLSGHIFSWLFHNWQFLILRSHPFLMVLLFPLVLPMALQEELWSNSRNSFRSGWRRVVIGSLGPALMLVFAGGAYLAGLQEAPKDPILHGWDWFGMAIFLVCLQGLYIYRLWRVRHLDLQAARARLMQILRQDPETTKRMVIPFIRPSATVTPDALVVETPSEVHSHPWSAIRHILFDEAGARAVVTSAENGDLSIRRDSAFRASRDQREQILSKWLEHIDPSISEFRAPPPQAVAPTPAEAKLMLFVIISLFAAAPFSGSPLPWNWAAFLCLIVLLLLSLPLLACVWTEKHSSLAKRRSPGLECVRLVEGGAEVTRRGKTVFMSYKELLPKRPTPKNIHRLLSIESFRVYNLSYWPLLRKKLLAVAAAEIRETRGN